MGLPIVDISGLASANPESKQAVAAEIRSACLRHGFFYCVGHGVPQGLINAAQEEVKALFDLPNEEKSKLDKANSPCNRGYEFLGGQTLQQGAMPDRKEGYYLGEELASQDPRNARFNQGANIWPSDLPGFRPTMTAYFAALSTVGASLMRGLALSLDLEENAFHGFTEQPLATLRLLHYPPSRPEIPDEMGAGAHTDFGGLTILLQNEVGGLEVKDPELGWIAAPPIEGAYVVNLGDMIARWTNDKYRSTLHRVINLTGKERYSIPFFYTGNPDYEVSCVSTCLADGDEPKYPPVRVEDHLRSMYEQTYVTRN